MTVLEEPQTVGEMLRFWRMHRKLSQLELALDAEVSTKHLSFVETGRAQPSRQLLVHLSNHLDLPLAEQNRLLLAGGFAPRYLDEPYHSDAMLPLREPLRQLGWLSGTSSPPAAKNVPKRAAARAHRVRRTARLVAVALEELGG